MIFLILYIKSYIIIKIKIKMFVEEINPKIDINQETLNKYNGLVFDFNNQKWEPINNVKYIIDEVGNPTDIIKFNNKQTTIFLSKNPFEPFDITEYCDCDDDEFFRKLIFIKDGTKYYTFNIDNLGDFIEVGISNSYINIYINEYTKEVSWNNIKFICPLSCKPFDNDIINKIMLIKYGEKENRSRLHKMRNNQIRKKLLKLICIEFDDQFYEVYLINIKVCSSNVQHTSKDNEFERVREIRRFIKNHLGADINNRCHKINDPETKKDIFVNKYYGRFPKNITPDSTFSQDSSSDIFESVISQVYDQCDGDNILTKIPIIYDYLNQRNEDYIEPYYYNMRIVDDKNNYIDIKLNIPYNHLSPIGQLINVEFINIADVLTSYVDPKYYSAISLILKEDRGFLSVYPNFNCVLATLKSYL